MDWDKLFSSKRLGGFSKSPDSRPGKATEGRSEFQKDFDRVVFSTEFRRLQNKTQVVPLPENDFVHTRLTHSLEASCVGRSLGKIVGDRVIRSNETYFTELGVTASDFEAVVAAACLAHDIGNPPFGHSGEEAISEYFRSQKAVKFLDGLSEKQIADLQNFEGNAAGFRLLTYTSPSHSEINFGLGLTFATLGAFTKYPKESLPVLQESRNASEKKYGFFQSEQEVFKEIAAELGLLLKADGADYGWHRHPLAFLVEAADDICYSIVDLEDGYKLGRVGFRTTEDFLLAIIGKSFTKLESNYKKIIDEKEKIGFLRALAINKLIWQCADLFSENAAGILSGSFDSHMTDGIPATPTLVEIERLSVKDIYKAQPIIEIEIAGFEVLAGLLDVFLNAIFNTESKYFQMVCQLLPDKCFDKDRKVFTDRYLNIIAVIDFVAGLTDNSAIGLYKKIKGISL